MMKKISILGLDNSLASTICGPMDIFAQAGMLYNKICCTNPSPFFQVEIVSVSEPQIKCLNNFYLNSHKRINEVDSTDILLIASGDYLEQKKDISIATKWIRKMYSKGTIVASICTGAFILAESGLLKNKVATTHWGYVNLFKEMYPDIDIRAERLVVDNESVLCSGGVNSYAELCLYLVKKYTTDEIAQQCSMSLVLDNRNISQNSYSIFEYQKKHGDHQVLKVQEILEQGFVQNPSLSELSDKVNMNERTLLRRFKKAIGESPQKYIHRLKIEMAKKEILNGNYTIEEICYRVGYENVKFFRTIFKRYNGLTPYEYKRRFSIKAH